VRIIWQGHAFLLERGTFAEMYDFFAELQGLFCRFTGLFLRCVEPFNVDVRLVWSHLRESWHTYEGVMSY